MIDLQINEAGRSLKSNGLVWAYFIRTTAVFSPTLTIPTENLKTGWKSKPNDSVIESTTTISVFFTVCRSIIVKMVHREKAGILLSTTDTFVAIVLENFIANLYMIFMACYFLCGLLRPYSPMYFSKTQMFWAKPFRLFFIHSTNTT